MKKYYFVFIIMAIIPTLAIAQTKPFTGYDKVAWGVSVNDVRQAYNIGEDIKAVVDDEDEPIVWLIQENVSDSIAKREFLFNKWNSNDYKLYRVVVSYKNGSDANHDSLKNLIEQRYGNRTNYNIQRGNSGSVVFPEPYTDYISTFGKFTPDIEVQLYHRKGTANILGTLIDTSEIRVFYTWKKYRDEYQASKLGF